MINNKLAQAIAGQTVYIGYTEMQVDYYGQGVWIDENDLSNWCSFFGLAFSSIDNLYKIYKP